MQFVLFCFVFSFSTCKRSSFLRYRSLGVHGLVPVPQVRGAEVRGSADLALKSSRIVDFGDKSSGFADLKNTVDRGSAESFGPVSGFCQSRSSDCGSDHQFSVGLGQCAGVLSANVPLPRFPEETFS